MIKIKMKGCEGLTMKVLGIDEKDLLVFREEDISQIRESLATLSPREQKVIALRFGGNLKYGQGGDSMPLIRRMIGEEMGVTGDRIRQIENRALWKLRHPSRIEAFERCSRYGLERQIKRLKERIKELGMEISTRT